MDSSAEFDYAKQGKRLEKILTLLDMSKEQLALSSSETYENIFAMTVGRLHINMKVMRSLEMDFYQKTRKFLNFNWFICGRGTMGLERYATTVDDEENDTDGDYSQNLELEILLQKQQIDRMTAQIQVLRSVLIDRQHR